MISAALVALSLSSTPAAVPPAPVLEIRYRRHRAHRARRARLLDSCCWPTLDQPAKAGSFGIEAFYDLFPAFKEGNR